MMVNHDGHDPDVAAIMAQLAKMDARFERVDGKVDAMAVQIERVAAGITPRAEIAAADDRRLLVETFQAFVSSNSERVSRLENGPQKMLGWISLAVSIVIGGIGCLGTLVAVAGTIFGVAWTLAHH